MINQVSLSEGSKSKQSKPGQKRKKKIFRILRHSLLRNQIFSSISKDFYLSPSREIIRSMTSSVVFLEILKAAMACTGISSSWGFCCLVSILNARVPLGSNFLKREPCEFVGSISGNTSIFPVRLISQISTVY